MAATWKKIAFEDDVILAALLTEQGDIIYRGAAAPAALPHGDAGDVLTSGGNGADPSWEPPAAGADYIAKAFMAAKGDLISASANDTPAILTVGDNGDILTADSDAANGLGIDWLPPGAPAAHTLNSHTAADGAVDFGGQQAHDVILDTYAAVVNLPSVNQIGMIAFVTATTAAYVITAYAA